MDRIRLLAADATHKQADWKGKPRGNDAHASQTDPDARLYRRNPNAAAILCYQGNVLMENRTGGAGGGGEGHAC